LGGGALKKKKRGKNTPKLFPKLPKIEKKEGENREGQTIRDKNRGGKLI